MRKLMLLATALMAFRSAKSAAQSGAAAGGRAWSWGSLLTILMAPKALRIPMLLGAFWAGRKAVPVRARRN